MRAWKWDTMAFALDSKGNKLPTEHRLLDGQGRHRASVWKNSDDRATWHTYDTDGTGGENSECHGDLALDDAKRHAVASMVRQGWAPGGWRIKW